MQNFHSFWIGCILCISKFRKCCLDCLVHQRVLNCGWDLDGFPAGQVRDGPPGYLARARLGQRGHSVAEAEGSHRSDVAAHQFDDLPADLLQHLRLVCSTGSNRHALIDGARGVAVFAKWWCENADVDSFMLRACL